MEAAAAFGLAVRARRKAAKISQEKLALDAGIERVFVSWIENGHKQPTFQTMLKIARALHCSAAELVEDAEKHLSAPPLRAPDPGL